MNVYYGDFWDDGTSGEAGKRISIEKTFSWHGYDWYVPAIYECSQGLVLDVCRKVPMTVVAEFYAYWNEENLQRLVEEEGAQVLAETPFGLGVNFEIEIESAPEIFHLTECSSVAWQSCRPDQAEAEELMMEYQCDRLFAWQFYRLLAEGKSNGSRELEKIKIIASADITRRRIDQYIITESIGGPQEIPFINPVTKENMIFYVEDCAQGDLPRKKEGDNEPSDIIGGSSCVVMVLGITTPPDIENGEKDMKYESI